MQTSPNNKQFLFVNKSGRSLCLSRSLPLEKSAVQRHVQTGRKRSRTSKHAKSSTDNSETHEPVSVSRPSEHRSQLVEQTRDGVVRHDSVATQQDRATGLRTDHSEALHEARDSIVSLTDQAILCKQDPFDAASLPIDKRVAGLLHYYLNFYHPSQWPNEMTLLRQGVYMFPETVSSIVQTAVQDKLVMYCLLGSASCRLQFIDRLPFPLVVGTENYYLHLAVQLMASSITSGRLQDPGQVDRFLLCVVFLSAAEAYRGDLPASATHLNAAVQVLKPHGGLAFVKNHILQGQLAMADLFIACVYLRPCLFDCSYDPGGADSLGLLDHELSPPCSTATASLLKGRQRTLIPSKLQVVIEELAESFGVKCRICTASMSSSRALQVTHWITLRNMALRNKFLSLTLIEQRSHSLRVAIIMWTLFAMNVTGRAKTVKVMAPELKRSLMDVPLSSWAENEDVKLWIMLLGLYCANEDSETSTWFMNESASLIDHCLPVVNSVSELAEQLEAFQQKFLFDVSVQRVRTRVLAEKLYHVAP